MTRATAFALWGFDVVDKALAEPAAEPITKELAELVGSKANELRDDAALARWALSLPWPRFCAVVRIVSGLMREELLDD